MIKRQEEKNLYFSTKVELKINGFVYRPSICYPVPSLARKSLENYEKEGKVTFYPNKVRFVNGALAVSLNEQSAGVASVVDEFSTSTRKRK